MRQHLESGGKAPDQESAACFVLLSVRVLGEVLSWCTCGNIGCLEAYACSGGILKRVNDALLKERDNDSRQPLTNLKQIDQMVMQGNEIVLNVIKETGVILGIAIANIANLLNPEMIVLFGGVTNLGENLVGPLKEEVKKRAFKKATESLRIELSQLGDNSGILGAARNILSKLQNQIHH